MRRDEMITGSDCAIPLVRYRRVPAPTVAIRIASMLKTRPGDGRRTARATGLPRADIYVYIEHINEFGEEGALIAL
jgi:hypothetical protein